MLNMTLFFQEQNILALVLDHVASLCLVAVFWLPPWYERRVGAVAAVCCFGFAVATFHGLGDRLDSAPGGSFLGEAVQGVFELAVFWFLIAVKWGALLAVSLATLAITREVHLRSRARASSAKQSGPLSREQKNAIRAGFDPAPKTFYRPLKVLMGLYAGIAVAELVFAQIYL